jgi:hypothetical protein
MAAGKPNYFNGEELEYVYGQISEGALYDRAWEYYSSLIQTD